MSKHFSLRLAAPLLLAVIGGVAGSAAQAHGVQWSVGINLPVVQTTMGYGAPAPVVYAQQPAVVYAPPQPMVQAYPQPVYAQATYPAQRVVYAQPAPVMVGGYYPQNWGHHHGHWHDAQRREFRHGEWARDGRGYGYGR